MYRLTAKAVAMILTILKGSGTHKLRRVGPEVCTEKRMTELELYTDEADVVKCLMVDEGVMADGTTK